MISGASEEELIIANARSEVLTKCGKDVLDILDNQNEKIDKLKEKDKEIERLSKEVDMWNKKYNEQFDIINEAIKYIKKNKKEITKEQADFYNEDRQNKLKIGAFMWNVDELLNILADKEIDQLEK